MSLESTRPDDTQLNQVSKLVDAAATASQLWAATQRADRARVLTSVADALDAAATELVPIAQAETNLPEPRLVGELKRTTFQLRLFAELLADGGYLDARIDQADPAWPMGAPRPDLRRILVPVGPVVVFAASNFPFAFSVAGGDTAAALAAGCAVLLKAHPGHLRLSAATGRVVAEALAANGAPAGLFAVIYGDEAGRAVLLAPAVKAGAFTGSVRGGRALFDLAASRPEPIPFFGELGSLNPVFVTPRAAEVRGNEIATNFIGSFTMGAGQFCTKPGLLVVPASSGLAASLAAATLPGPARLLNDRIAAGYQQTLTELSQRPGVSVLNPAAAEADAAAPAPTLLRTGASDLLADPEALLVECFGPAALVVEYDDQTELLSVAESLDGQLTATIVAEEGDEIVPELLPRLVRKAGRVLWNQWPTGVSVTYAQQHGGPYPATTAPATTSVGTAAITRFLRPVAYQGFPEQYLPAELQLAETGLPRLVDGKPARSATTH